MSASGLSSTVIKTQASKLESLELLVFKVYGMLVVYLALLGLPVAVGQGP